MKNIIFIISFIFASSVSFGQIDTKLVKSGNFYELSELWVKDSVSVKKLINTYNLDISKLDTVQFYKELHTNYSYTSYVYTLDKKTGVITMDSFPHVGVCSKLNKYVMVFCFDDYTDKKVINIKVF